MKMERKSLLFFDIDGTIFDDQRQLPKSVRPAMEEARNNGCQLVINTGRTLCQIDRRLDGFPLDGWIMGCGTRIIYHGETIQGMEYDLKSSLKLRKIFYDLKIPLVYECDTGMYFDPDFSSHPDVKRLRKWSEERGIYREIRESDADFRAVKMFCFTPEASIKALEKLSTQIGMPYTAIKRGPDTWEVVPEGYSKGRGIDILRQRIGVELEDCYAFGDSTNDLSMLQHVPHSIAMGNAAPEVKSVCSYVTDLPENDGIEKAMRHFGLI